MDFRQHRAGTGAKLPVRPRIGIGVVLVVDEDADLIGRGTVAVWPKLSTVQRNTCSPMVRPDTVAFGRSDRKRSRPAHQGPGADGREDREFPTTPSGRPVSTGSTGPASASGCSRHRPNGHLVGGDPIGAATIVHRPFEHMHTHGEPCDGCGRIRWVDDGARNRSPRSRCLMREE